VRTTLIHRVIAICNGRFARASLYAILLAVAACGSGPPVQEMSDARQAIAVAREAGAAEYAPEDLRAAETHLDTALRSLSKKEYRQARVEAREAKVKALDALATSEHSVPDEPRP